ncbi:MAG: ABC transporter ATP-binding protein [Cytophagaceae bacterium]
MQHPDSRDILKIRNVEKKYGQKTALQDFSLNVPKQSILGLLGPNGAGKTSLIRIITQIIAPDKGDVLFNGEKLSPKHTSLVGYLPEERGLYKKMKVDEQLIYLAGLKEVSKIKAKQKIEYFLERFELMSWKKRIVEELSKGMQQKVQFIASVIHDPQLLILDEPFSGFDPLNSQILKEEMMRLKEQGCTIIYSTHRMETVEELCDTITLIDNGVKLLEGRVPEIKKQYNTERYRLRGRGRLPDTALTFDLQVQQTNQDITEARLQLKEGKILNDMIREVIGEFEIQNIEEDIPGIHDIFIARIREAKK